MNIIKFYLQRLFPIVGVVIFIFVFSTCSSKQNSSKKENALGGRVYGGTLHINSVEKTNTFFPHKITDAFAAHISTQIYEGLVKFSSQDLTIKPCIAESWEIDTTGKIYTFHLKKGVFFHDDICFKDRKGREVTAHDFKYCFDLLCTNYKENYGFSGTFQDKVLGATEHFNSSKKDKLNEGVEGVKVIDNYTLQITLLRPDFYFLHILALPTTSVFPREAFDLYLSKTTIGTGPFILLDNGKTDPIRLVKNQNYHIQDSLGNQLPFLDSIIVSFIQDKKDELKAFQTGYLDMMIGLPPESVTEIVEKNIQDFKGDSAKYMLDRVAEMSTQYYNLSVTKKPFDNIKVRQAFNYAIDRKKIVEQVLKSEAYGPGIYGICPPSFKGYEITQIKGYDVDIIKARKLLAEAGYPGGKGFPEVKLELNSGGQKHSAVAIEIQKQLYEALGVMITMEVVPFSQRLEDAKYARAEMFRAAWIADFPTPENFLWTLYGANVPDSLNQPSFPNITRYKSAIFDTLFEKGRKASTLKESYEFFAQAEQQMMKDSPILVLWYDENFRLTHSYVKNFHRNPMRYRDYSEVYLKK